MSTALQRTVRRAVKHARGCTCTSTCQHCGRSGYELSECSVCNTAYGPCAAVIEIPNVCRWCVLFAAKRLADPERADCPACGGTGFQECDDPHCTDANWDPGHNCTAGRCEECLGSGKLEES